MKPSKLRNGICLAAVLGTGAVTFDHWTGAETVQAQAVRIEPPLAASRASAVNDLQSAVNQTGAVVEGWVTDIQYEYSDEEGPWTRVTMSDVHAHFGSAPARLEIRHFGGPLPNGRTMVVAELPVFVLGKQYVVFLRNTAWNISPVVGDLALRVETVDRTEVLVNSDGLAVTSVNPGGVGMGAALFQGPERDGTPPKALKTGLQALESQPLDRQHFVAALGVSLATHRLRVAGDFQANPSGEFKWRGQRTARSARQVASIDAPANKVGRPSLEVDTPQQSR